MSATGQSLPTCKDGRGAHVHAFAIAVLTDLTKMHDSRGVSAQQVSASVVMAKILAATSTQGPLHQMALQWLKASSDELADLAGQRYVPATFTAAQRALLEKYAAEPIVRAEQEQQLQLLLQEYTPLVLPMARWRARVEVELDAALTQWLLSHPAPPVPPAEADQAALDQAMLEEVQRQRDMRAALPIDLKPRVSLTLPNGIEVPPAGVLVGKFLAAMCFAFGTIVESEAGIVMGKWAQGADQQPRDYVSECQRQYEAGLRSGGVQEEVAVLAARRGLAAGVQTDVTNRMKVLQQAVILTFDELMQYIKARDVAAFKQSQAERNLKLLMPDTQDKAANSVTSKPSPSARCTLHPYSKHTNAECEAQAAARKQKSSIVKPSATVATVAASAAPSSSNLDIMEQFKQLFTSELQPAVLAAIKANSFSSHNYTVGGGIRSGSHCPEGGTQLHSKEGGAARYGLQLAHRREEADGSRPFQGHVPTVASRKVTPMACALPLTSPLCWRRHQAPTFRLPLLRSCVRGYREFRQSIQTGTHPHACVSACKRTGQLQGPIAHLQHKGRGNRNLPSPTMTGRLGTHASLNMHSICKATTKFRQTRPCWPSLTRWMPRMRHTAICSPCNQKGTLQPQ